MRFCTEAIVIRRSEYSESSQVAHLLTAMEGRISVLARGSHRERSPFGGPLDLLTRGRADIGRRRRGGLDLIYRFDLVHPYRTLRRTRLHWVAGCHLLELIRMFSWPSDQESSLFGHLAATLDGIEGSSGAAAVETWLAAFSARLLESGGFRPQVEACVGCGRAPVPGEAGFSPARGGVVCHTCRKTDPQALSCSDQALALHRRLIDGVGAVQSDGAAPLSPEAVMETRWHLEQCLQYRLERPLRTSLLLRGELGHD